MKRACGEPSATMRRRWGDEMIAKLRSLADRNVTVSAAAEILNRSRGAVRFQASKNGISFHRRVLPDVVSHLKAGGALHREWYDSLGGRWIWRDARSSDVFFSGEECEVLREEGLIELCHGTKSVWILASSRPEEGETP